MISKYFYVNNTNNTCIYTYLNENMKRIRIVNKHIFEYVNKHKHTIELEIQIARQIQRGIHIQI